jgi:hypothetical protein
MRSLLFGVLIALACSGCSSQSSDTGPSATNDVTGTWRGQFVLAGASQPMTWTLVQAGTSVSGPVFVAQSNGIVLMNGTLAGTLTGTSLAYTISVAQGNIPSQPACAGQLTGTMTVQFAATSTMSGTYAVASSTCAVPFGTTGNLNLTR